MHVLLSYAAEMHSMFAGKSAAGKTAAAAKAGKNSAKVLPHKCIQVALVWL